MSILRKKVPHVHRHLSTRRETSKPLESIFHSFFYGFRTYPQAATLVTLASTSHDGMNSRRLPSIYSHTSVSLPFFVQRLALKDKIGCLSLSTRANEIIDKPTWLIPRKGTGFDNFLNRKKNSLDVDEDSNSNEEGKNRGEPEGSEDNTDPKVKKNKGDEDENEKKKGDVFGSFRSKYSDDNTRNNSEGGNGGSGVPPNFNGNTLIMFLVLAGLSYSMIRNDDDSASPTDFSREITWNDFCNYLLETGQVEKIVVTNNRTIAKVFLKRGSHGLPQHQSRQFNYLNQRRHKVLLIQIICLMTRQPKSKMNTPLFLQLRALMACILILMKKRINTKLSTGLP